eukprot:4970579-Amphidinium_carterae.1
MIAALAFNRNPLAIGQPLFYAPFHSGHLQARSTKNTCAKPLAEPGSMSLQPMPAKFDAYLMATVKELVCSSSGFFPKGTAHGNYTHQRGEFNCSKDLDGTCNDLLRKHQVRWNQQTWLASRNVSKETPAQTWQWTYVVRLGNSDLALTPTKAAAV